MFLLNTKNSQLSKIPQRLEKFIVNDFQHVVVEEQRR